MGETDSTLGCCSNAQTTRTFGALSLRVGIKRTVTVNAVIAQKSGQVGAERYTLAKTIVHGPLVLMTWPVGISVPFAWLTLYDTIASVFCCSLKPSSALAA